MPTLRMKMLKPIVVAVLMTSAVPALAQTPVATAPISVSAGYHFLKFNGGESLPAGVYAAVNSTGRVGLMGTVHANFESIEGAAVKHTVLLGGVRLTGRRRGPQPFVHLLAGLAHSSASFFGVSVDVNAPTIAAGGGIDLLNASGMGVRLQIGGEFSHYEQNWNQVASVTLGFVFGVGRAPTAAAR